MTACAAGFPRADCNVLRLRTADLLSSRQRYKTVKYFTQASSRSAAYHWLLNPKSAVVRQSEAVEHWRRSIHSQLCSSAPSNVRAKADIHENKLRIPLCAHCAPGRRHACRLLTRRFLHLQQPHNSLVTCLIDPKDHHLHLCCLLGCCSTS